MRKAVVSCAFGSGWEKISETTFPRMQNYAKLHNLDFYVVKKLIEPGCYSKSIIGSLLKENYSKILFLDADVLITKNCEDFETWTEQESDFLALNESLYYPPRKQDIKKMSNDFGFFHCNPEFYFNTGVFVMNRNAIGALSLPPINLFPKDYGEQTWLNVMLHLWKIKTANLDPVYNCMSSIEYQLGMNKFKEAKIIHYAGQSKDLNALHKKIQNDNDALEKLGK